MADNEGLDPAIVDTELKQLKGVLNLMDLESDTLVDLFHGYKVRFVCFVCDGMVPLSSGHY